MPGADNQVIFFLPCSSEHQWLDHLGVRTGESGLSGGHLFKYFDNIILIDPNRVQMRKPPDLFMGSEELPSEKKIP